MSGRRANAARLLVAIALAAAALIGPAAVRPASALSICPNCATITVTLSGFGTGTVTDGTPGGIDCIYVDGYVKAGSVCTGHYAWSVAQATTDVTLTATPNATTYVCDTTTPAVVCLAPGAATTDTITLSNGQSVGASFAFHTAPVGHLVANLSGDGAGSVFDADTPALLNCAWAAGVSSGTCEGQFVMNPGTSMITVSVAAKPTSTSIACYLDVSPHVCGAAGKTISVDIVVNDGGVGQSHFSFTRVSAPTPPPTPAVTSSPSARPKASPSTPPTAHPTTSQAATATAPAPVPTVSVGPSDSSEATLTSPGASPAESPSDASTAVPTATPAAIAPAAATGADVWPLVAAVLAVIVALLVGSLIGLGWRGRGPRRS